MNLLGINIEWQKETKSEKETKVLADNRLYYYSYKKRKINDKSNKMDKSKPNNPS